MTSTPVAPAAPAPAPDPAAPARSRGHDLAGTGVLYRLALRRDRIALPVWVYIGTGMVASTAFSFRELYGDEAARRTFTAGIDGNGSLRALYGPVFDGSTIGGLTAWRMGVFGAVLAALMSTLLVVRHTRAEEEDGRLELVGAGAVGRRAPLTAALAAALTANAALAALVAAALIGAGQAAAGALAFALGLGATGLFFAALAAVTAQLAETARAANGLAGAAIGTAFVLRAVGDSGSGAGWVGWLSPLGWAEQVRAFGGDRWWVLLLPLAGAALLTALARALVARRDLGAGLLPQRPGPAAAAPALASAAALARRLQRGPLLGWTLAFAAAGAVFGGVAKGVVDLIGDNRQMADVLARLGGQRGVLDAYLSSIATMLGMTAAVYAVQAVLRMRAEEVSGRAEPVLAGAVSRLRWAAGHLLFPLLGTALPLAAAGLTAGLAEGLALGGGAGGGGTGGGAGGAVGRMLGATLVQLPAVWLTAAVALAAYGLLPRRAAAGWAGFGLFVLVSWLGPILRLPQAVLDLSPFSHLPHLPGGGLTAAPLFWITALTALTATAGLAALRRRDLG
ncbi:MULTISPECIES: putative multidrug ABC transporter permease protein [Kitasatospora]|uniref:Putative multidrug ABC transporter permease protein n=1 Tax=Kitasatospora setae (strain ATCC 33774 / DSM 43861 / JCM 3304 / KCC A-0304 / NBRC 14216 / KM-6054) TaxID=452652 RepID=E4N078_KITSK|nr:MULTISPECIES: putative multidrug ABC transporter permease protein [Kitasatospora]BAJ31406.1 putative multidrug ABC transporter permease protein [Kitasatospora setae KM-6054]